MKIILAKNAGFCFGVRRAVELTEQTAAKVAESGGAAKVFTFGELIHNRDVVNRLREAGIAPIESLDEAQRGDYVIIRSHGVPKKIYEELETRGINFIDATCPFVSNIHRIVSAAYERGEQVFIVGNPEHPETIGINGHCGNSAIFIRGEEELRKLEGRSGCLVVQTTFDSETFAAMQRVIEREYPRIRVFNSICSTTFERQREAEELSKKCDVMLVLGDKHSSNTQKLRKICEKNCRNTLNAAKECEISLDIFKNNDIMVGVVAGASTPDSIIREVINTMSEQDKANVNCEAATENAAANAANIEENAVFDEEAINKTIVRIHGGQVLTGTVIQIVDGEISVSIGYKSDGYIPRSEFSNDPDLDPASQYKVGDPIEVEVLKVNDGEGNVLLSRKNVESQKAWEEFTASAESEGKVLEGTCKEAIKGGVIVSLANGASAFVPASQVSTKYVADLKEFVGKPMKIKVLEVDAKRRRIIGSAKAVLLAEAEAAKEAVWDSLTPGMKVMGTVRRIVDFGVFVDIGGVDGMVHVSELSWNRIKNPAEVVKVGDEIDVYVIALDPEKKKISLGYKTEATNPWTIFNNEYKVGDVVTVKIVKLMTFGAFAEIIPGVDGLIHISQIADRRIGKPEDVLSEGQEVDAKIIDIDQEHKRISLSIRQAAEDEFSFDDEAMGEEAPVDAEEAPVQE